MKNDVRDIVILGAGGLGQATAAALVAHQNFSEQMKITVVEQHADGVIPNGTGSGGGTRQLGFNYEKKIDAKLSRRGVELFFALQEKYPDKKLVSRDDFSLIFKDLPEEAEQFVEQASTHGVPFDEIKTEGTIQQVNPIIKPHHDMTMFIYKGDKHHSGVAHVQAVVDCWQQQAEIAGVEYLFGKKVVKISTLRDGQNVTLITENNERIATKKLIVCVGPWVYTLFPQLRHLYNQPLREEFYFAKIDSAVRLPHSIFKTNKGEEVFITPLGQGKIKFSVADHNSQVDLPQIEKSDEVCQTGREQAVSVLQSHFQGVTLLPDLPTSATCLPAGAGTDDKSSVVIIQDIQSPITVTSLRNGECFKIIPAIAETLADFIFEGSVSEGLSSLVHYGSIFSSNEDAEIDQSTKAKL